jgi:hypothetical protein
VSQRVDWSAPALRHMTTAPRIRHCERMLRTATSVPERETYRAELRCLRGESETQPCAALVIARPVRSSNAWVASSSS